MSLPSSILRIGPTNDNASALILHRALLDHFQSSSSPAAEASNNMLNVTNRYFSAPVLLEELGYQSKTEKEDGIILVFDALQSNPDIQAASTSTFNALTSVHDEAMRTEQDGDLLRMCVGVAIGEMTPEELRGKKHEEEYSRRVLWCLDRGYEYVEADLSEEGQSKGHEDRDKDGFARIIEAIASTVWSCAKMGVSKREALMQACDEPAGDKKSPAQDTATAASDSKASKPSGSSEVGSPLPAKNETDQILETIVGEEADEKTSDEDDNQEKVLEQMEKLLGDAAKIREASKAGDLPDEERRKRAGDAAALLMGLMDKLGCDDDSDDSEDLSDDENSIADDD